jgi:hypothetical protein
MDAALFSMLRAGCIAASTGQWPPADASEAVGRRPNKPRCHGLAALIHAAARLLLVAAICSALPASAEVIQDVVSVSSGVLTQDDWEIRYSQPNGDGTGLVLTLARSSSPDPAIEITPEDYFLGIVFSWYEASEDEVFDGSVVENRSPFAANWGVRTPIAVPAEVPFFLTSWSGMGFDEELNKPIIGPDDYYTWGKFVVNDVDGQLKLSALGSAMARTGIVVGKPVAVPEPSTSALAIAGLGGLGYSLCRRRGRPSKPAARASREGMRPEQMQPVLGDLPTGGIGRAPRLLRSWAGEGRSRR